MRGIPRRSRRRAPAKRATRAAYVQLGEETIIVVEVAAWVVVDPFEAQLALHAIELTCGRPAVLCAVEPCGCRQLYGRTEHVGPLDRMPRDSLEWRDVDFDFARPRPARGLLN